MTHPHRAPAAPPPSKPLIDPFVLALCMFAAIVVGALIGGAALSGLIDGRGMAWPHGGITTLVGWAKHPGDPAAAWPAGTAHPGSALAMYSIAAAIAMLAALVWAGVWIEVGARRDRKRFAGGLASTRQVAGVLGEEAGKAEAIRTRASLEGRDPKDIDADELVARVGFNVLDGKPIVVQNKDTVIVIGPTGAGKSWRVAVDKIRTAPGSVVVTSTRSDLLVACYLERARKGEVAVFDPENVSGWPVRIRWSLIAGCEDPDVAKRRAEAMVAARPMGSGASSNAAWFARRAAVILRSYLFAAATVGGTLADVMRWADEGNPEEVKDILAEHLPAWGQKLSKALNSGDARTDGNVRSTVEDILDPLSSPKLLAAVDASAGESFDVPGFVASGTGSLFVISDGGNGSVSPFAAALVNECHQVGYLSAPRKPKRRLDPPMRLVLDEAMNVATLPELGKKMTDSGGVGINLWVFVHNIDQVRKRLGTTEAADLIGSATARLVLAGLLSPADLHDASELLGTITEWQASHGQHGITHSQVQRPVLTPDEIRTLGTDEGLLIYRNQPGVLLRLPAYWDGNAGAETVKTSLALCERVTAAAAVVDDINGRRARTEVQLTQLAQRLAEARADVARPGGLPAGRLEQLAAELAAVRGQAAADEAAAAGPADELTTALAALDEAVAAPATAASRRPRLRPRPVHPAAADEAAQEGVA